MRSGICVLGAISNVFSGVVNMSEAEFRLTSLSEVFPLLQACFPDVQPEAFDSVKGDLTAFIMDDVCFSIVWVGREGALLSYIGTLPEYRGRGYAMRMVTKLQKLLVNHVLYAECVPGSVMYDALMKRGWGDYRIPYVCPAWGSMPQDTSRHLLSELTNKNCMPFVKELYKEGYGVDDAYLMSIYEWAQRTIYLPQSRTEEMLELFHKTFDDDVNTIRESLERADCYVVLDEQEEKIIAFCIFNHYKEQNAVVVEYIGVAESHRKNHIATMLFRLLESERPGCAFYGECHLEDPIVQLLGKEGWTPAPINWVCPAWGDIPEDTSRHLICKNASAQNIVDFSEQFYSYGYGVSHPELVQRYKEELGLC